MSSTAVLCNLLTPACQLHESCKLWWAYASSEMEHREADPAERLCECCRVPCDCRCHDYEKPTRRAKSAAALRSTGRDDAAAAAAAESARLSQEALRKSALDDWHTRKSVEFRLNRRAKSQLVQDEETKRLDEEATKREEGRSAYQSWMNKKQESGWGKSKRDAERAAEEAKAAEKAQNEADTRAAIEKWRSRKDVETAQLRRERRKRQEEEEAAKAAAAEEKATRTRRERDVWSERKQKENEEKRKARRDAELAEFEDKRRAEAEKQEAARLAFQDWCNRKDSGLDTVDGATKEQGKKRPWKPNSTVRRK